MIWLLVIALQTSPADPHAGRYTNGTGLPCAYCHDSKRPRSQDMYRAAAAMAKMVAGINSGPLARRSQIDCFSCHRAGPNHLLHPQVINRQTVERIVAAWPGPRDTPEGVRRAMGGYSVSLGVACSFCHTPGKWKSDRVRDPGGEKEKPQIAVTRRMIAMMDEFPKYFDAANAAAFTCYTCHQGAQLVPH